MKSALRISIILMASFIMLALTSGPLGWVPGLAHGSIALAETNEGESYLAIVDVYVTNRSSSNPNLMYPEYTALSWAFLTSPYISGSVGTYVPAADINSGIGGSYTYIWVKYAWVAPTDDTPVLVDIAVHHWPYWVVSCPEGWTAARGDSGGALTTGTDGPCWRNGLCVHFVPMNQTNTFITNLKLYFGTSDEPTVPALAPANGGYWPMTQDDLDIHRGCGDGKWMYILYNQAHKWPAMPVALPSPSDAGKAAILRTYAPRVWLAEGEMYYPSSVDWSFDYLNRYVYDSSWRLRTNQSLASPSDVLTYFHGCDGISTNMPCTLSDTPVYAFWDEVNINVEGTTVKVVDLIYFFYYPYNRGKELLSTIWGNHVGDWEYLSLRLIPAWDEQSSWSFGPAQTYLSVHDFGHGYLWDQMPRVMGDVVFLPLISKLGALPDSQVAAAGNSFAINGMQDLLTHPVIYSAWGSHGVWLDPGAHTYRTIPILGDLTDYTSPGTTWDTWRRIEAYSFDTHTGLGQSIWPTWMSKDYSNLSSGNENPASGPIYRWGNTNQGCDPISGYCRLEDGPTGPVDKNVWDVEVLK